MLQRNIKITFRLNQKESNHLKRLVKRSGLSQEAYLRQLINGLVPRDLPPPDYFSMMQALYAVGDALRKIDDAHCEEALQLYRQTVRDITAAVILPQKRSKV